MSDIKNLKEWFKNSFDGILEDEDANCYMDILSLLDQHDKLAKRVEEQGKDIDRRIAVFKRLRKIAISDCERSQSLTAENQRKTEALEKIIKHAKKRHALRTGVVVNSPISDWWSKLLDILDEARQALDSNLT